MFQSAEKRGRVYKCGRCGYLQEKRRCISHFYKHHVAMNDTPYYCTLCKFQCIDREQLDFHAGRYPMHINRRDSLKSTGKFAGDAAYLVKSRTPYMWTDNDVKVLSREFSRRHWELLDGAPSAGDRVIPPYSPTPIATPSAALTVSAGPQPTLPATVTSASALTFPPVSPPAALQSPVSLPHLSLPPVHLPPPSHVLQMATLETVVAEHLLMRAIEQEQLSLHEEPHNILPEILGFEDMTTLNTPSYTSSPQSPPLASSSPLRIVRERTPAGPSSPDVLATAVRENSGLLRSLIQAVTGQTEVLHSLVVEIQQEQKSRDADARAVLSSKENQARTRSRSPRGRSPKRPRVRTPDRRPPFGRR